MLADTRRRTNHPLDDLDEDTMRRRLEKICNSPRGLLALYPPDVIAIINGEPYTIADRLRAKREKNNRCLACKRMPDNITLPAHIHVFDNGPICLFGGMWTHIQVNPRRRSWTVERVGRKDDLQMMIMRAFPLGYLPSLSFYRQWQEAFMVAYRYSDTHRTRHGRVVAWITLDSGVFGKVTSIAAHPPRKDLYLP